jgi:hypothetical protein
MKIRVKIIALLHSLWERADYGIRWLCLAPSPCKRLVTALVLVAAFGGANIYFVASSIYNMGKRDAEKKFIQLQHIKAIRLQNHNDSINILNQKEYEYGQSNE